MSDTGPGRGMRCNEAPLFRSVNRKDASRPHLTHHHKGRWNERNEWDECGEMVEWNLWQQKLGEPHEKPTQPPFHPPPQTTSAANLKLHTNSSSNPNTPPDSTPINPLNSTLAPVALKRFNSVSSILLLRKATVIWPKIYHFHFVSSLYVLPPRSLTPRPSGGRWAMLK